MTLTDEQVKRLRELPGGVFRVIHVRAIAGNMNDIPGRVAVYAKVQPSVVRWHDNDEEIVQFNEGDEIELVPHRELGKPNRWAALHLSAMYRSPVTVNWKLLGGRSTKYSGLWS